MSYKDGFIIEYLPFEGRKHTSCRDCIYANLNDKSCEKRPIVFREDGYDSWKRCEFFDTKNSKDKQKKNEEKKIYSKYTKY